MIDDTLQKIERQINAAQSVKPERKEELLQLLATLKEEVAALSTTHGEQAASIARFTEVSAQEATRAKQDPEQLDLSLDQLRSSTRSFEQSHPRLVQIVNAISRTLSDLGI